MKTKFFVHGRRALLWAALFLVWLACRFRAEANPTGGTVTQGQATITGEGTSQINVNQSSGNAFINWQTFNIASGETVDFNQPSSSAVTWNYIGDVNPSSIDGLLNANGLVVLQNPNGFIVGGTATINTHGLIMTTASTPSLNFSSTGPWSFDAPPPTAKIVNYGQINIAGGGLAYLIASDIENDGTISAPGGNIGLYAGETVLVSTRPDGRGLSAPVTLPQGSVNNEGKLIADAGSIAAQAQTVNQNGVVQANSVQSVNGTIELVASGSMTLGANSQISAVGDSTDTSASPGGFAVLYSGGTYSDQKGSTISVAGNSAGGQGGIVEFFGSGGINSSVSGDYAELVNPNNMTLSANATSTSTTSGSSPNFNISNLAPYSQIDLWAGGSITLSTPWILANPIAASVLNLTAGNKITIDSATSSGTAVGIGTASGTSGYDWDINLTAGFSLPSGTLPASGNDGIYLNGNAYLYTRSGDINLWAANEVILTDGSTTGGTTPVGRINTLGGGNISVTTEYGNINTGINPAGSSFLNSGLYYTPASNLGGISTADGGNVTLTAVNGNVSSFSASTVTSGDAGSGAFGPEAGNVTINAGGTVSGSFVVANGTGTINAQNIGSASQNVALSLVDGGWTLNAVENIYLQEVRNPNGVYNSTTVFSPTAHNYVPSAGNHLFTYGSDDFLTLDAGNGVYITGANLPRPSGGVPLILPPTLTINAGAGGVTLDSPTAANGVTLADNDITLFPSPDGNLDITTIDGGNLYGNGAYLLMSDSGRTQWSAAGAGSEDTAFGPADHAADPAELDNYTPVTLNISGNMENVIFQPSKFANITVNGNMTGCSFYGENLRPDQETSITVNGNLDDASSFNSAVLSLLFPDILQLSESLLLSGDTFLPTGDADNWFSILQLAVNPSLNSQNVSGVALNNISAYLQAFQMFPGLDYSSMGYDPSTGKLSVSGPLSSSLATALETGTLTLVVYQNGYPIFNQVTLPNGGRGETVETKTITWLPQNSSSYTDPDIGEIQELQSESANAPALGSSGAIILGGGGTFDVTVGGSVNLGNSEGILTVGDGGTPSTPFLGQVSYSYLAPYLGASGANLLVNVDGTDPSPNQSVLDMPASAIASMAGGSVTVNTPNGSMDLGSADLAAFEGQIMTKENLGLGIYTTAGGNVNVTAEGTVNVDTSRIATFDGGDVTITSKTGDVNAGSAGAVAVPINVFLPGVSLPMPFEGAYASGIETDTLQPQENGSPVPGAATLPGNIYVYTPEGDIIANAGGILQESLSGILPPGSSINLFAGTPPDGNWSLLNKPGYSPEYVGNIDLGQLGAIGGTINVKATGKVSGLLISQDNATVIGNQFNQLTLLSAGGANVSGAGGTGVTIIGGQGVNASGVGGDAILVGPTVSSGGGPAHSGLAAATATAASQSAAQSISKNAAQEVAENTFGYDNGDNKKKATVRVSRVTVLLSAAVPGH